MDEKDEGLKCPNCGKRASDQDELDRHMNKEHRER